MQDDCFSVSGFQNLTNMNDHERDVRRSTDLMKGPEALDAWRTAESLIDTTRTRSPNARMCPRRQVRNLPEL